MSIIKGKPWIEDLFDNYFYNTLRNEVLNELNRDEKDQICDYDNLPDGFRVKQVFFNLYDNVYKSGILIRTFEDDNFEGKNVLLAYGLNETIEMYELDIPNRTYTQINEPLTVNELRRICENNGVNGAFCQSPTLYFATAGYQVSFGFTQLNYTLADYYKDLDQLCHNWATQLGVTINSITDKESANTVLETLRVAVNASGSYEAKNLAMLVAAFGATTNASRVKLGWINIGVGSSMLFDDGDFQCFFFNQGNLTKLTSTDMFTDIQLNNSEFTEIKII